MLTKLSIQNYALINHLEIDFTEGLSIITGETGAGKSILLGALGLVLGNRADLSYLKNSDEKCIIEAEFSIEKYKLKDIFEELDLDYEDKTILRREILPSGKSRAFINDTPARLSDLTDLKLRLIDIHSQHQTLELSDQEFQFSIIDALAKNQDRVESYKRGLSKLNKLKKELKTLEDEQAEANQQYDYNLFLFNELEDANFEDENEQNELEEKLDKLNNVEDIKLNLSEALQIALNEEIGLQTMLHSLEYKVQKISSFTKEYEELAERISSVKIELDDILLELEREYEDVDFDPNQLEQINDRLQLIYDLQKKHRVSSIKELQEIHEDLAEKVDAVENTSDAIIEKQKEIKAVADKLDELASIISEHRAKAIPKLKKELESLLSELGMQNARFQVEVKLSEQYFNNGKDELEFLFSANKGGKFGELKKVASGGELSRIMLCIKKVLSEHMHLPTIIFDEIDTGVSGEISTKIADIMKLMSKNIQVMTITHLPQVASKGLHHYKVYKQDVKGVTESNLKLLTQEERIEEIAEMLHGKSYSESAINHAKELLSDS